MSVLAAIGVLALLIVIHELGHFLAARLQGIHVNRFSIGFGPILWKYQGPETEYALRGFPLGGYVGFPDDDPESSIPTDDPNLLRNRPVLDRAIVISAGVIANLIFAYFLLVAHVGLVGIQQMQSGVQVSQIANSLSVAAAAGIQAKDIILSADGQDLATSRPGVQTFQKIIQSNPNEPISLTIQRNEKKIRLTIVPQADSQGIGRIGVILKPNETGPGVTVDQLTPELSLTSTTPIQKGDVFLSANGQTLGESTTGLQQLQKVIQEVKNQPLDVVIKRGDEQITTQVREEKEQSKKPMILQLAPNVVKKKTSNIFEAFGAGAEQFEKIVVLTFQGFGQLVSNFNSTAEQIAGPVKIVEQGAKLAESDITNLFWFAALISINLGVLNILPLPALDGGQLAFLLIEGLRGKPLPTKIQDGVMQTGLMLLLGLGIFLIIRDTTQLEVIQKLLP
ncbi:MAG TPA: RIP metalloprotease RseP [Halomicronema sp.]